MPEPAAALTRRLGSRTTTSELITRAAEVLATVDTRTISAREVEGPTD